MSESKVMMMCFFLLALAVVAAGGGWILRIPLDTTSDCFNAVAVILGTISISVFLFRASVSAAKGC